MNSLGLIFSILLVVGMFILLRRIERWLHQHIFKVGWLLTKNFQTTTILYYTFFLPGVFLHELTYWLTAGILNVRATVSIPFFKKETPAAKDEKQAKAPVAETPKPPPTNTIDISKLKPNFVTLDFGSRGRGRQAQKGIYRKAIISTVPLLVALVCIWLIADKVFNIMGVVATMASGELPDIAEAFNTLISTPNFWLWVYVVFTIANTMFPFVPEELRGWRTVLITTVAVALALTLIGVGGEIFKAMQSPLVNLISVMEVTLILIIIVDVLMVLVLGTIEYVIEHVTGNTATFRGSTMEVMTREEAASFREAELQRQRRREERFERQRNKAADSGLSNVYMLMFPIPGAPGEEPITQVVEDKPVKRVPVVKEQPVPTQPPEIPAASTPTREKPEDLAARIHIPERKPLIPRQPESDADETEDTEAKPATTLADRSATVTPDKAVDIDVDEKQPAEREGVSPFARQLVSPVTETDDEDEADEAALVRTPTSQSTTTPDKVPESDKDEEDEADEEPAKPIATFRSTALRSSPVAKPVETDESDEEADAEPAQPVTSRFGVSPIRSPMQSASDDTEDNEADEIEKAKPAAPLSSRFSVSPSRSLRSSDSDETEEDSEAEAKPATAFNSRFSVKPFTETIDDEVEEDSSDEVIATKPIASLGSRFSSTPLRGTQAPESDSEADDVEAEKSPVAESAPDKPIRQLSESRDEIEGKPDAGESEPAAPIKSRFGSSPRSVTAADSDDEKEDNAETEQVAYAKPKGLFTRPTVDDTENESGEKIDTKPLASPTSRFGVTPFKGTSPAEQQADEEKAEDGDEPEEDMTPAKPKGLVFTSDKDNKPPLRPSASRFGTTPFGRRVEPEEDEDEANDDESFLRRGRGDDAVSSLFSGLSTSDKTDDSDEDDEEEDTLSRFGSTPSRFGNRSAARATDDDDVEYADDEEYYEYDDADEYSDDDDADYDDDDD